jgi:hypothetical protein
MTHDWVLKSRVSNGLHGIQTSFFFGQLGSLFPLEPLQMDQWDFEAVLLRPQYLLLMEGLYIAAIATFLALRQNLQLERKEELWDSWAV